MKLLRTLLNFMSKPRLTLPLVVICGGTGTGKSKLAIEIAKHYNGEVINADALQIYKGMDIATNKVTEEECQGIRHHLLGFESVEKLDYTIHDFQKAALQKIEELKSENKMPVLVGGTNYYIESILWHKLVDVDSEIPNADKLNGMDNNELYDYLKSLDPESASLLHPNTRRKVFRAIEIALNSSQTQYDHLKSQNSSRRFPLNETVFLWVDSDQDSLFPRLEKRVDEMVASGLLEELSEMHKLFLSLCPSQSFTKGVFQAIGFKEFRDYLALEDKSSENAQKVLSECVERLKLANKQYVRVQNKWIRNRFLRASADDRNVPLWRMDSSDVSNWRKAVLERSLTVIEAVRRQTHIDGYHEFVAAMDTAPETLTSTETFTPCQNVCEVCGGRVFVSMQAWRAHLAGGPHSRALRRRRKRALVVVSDNQ